MRGGRRRTKEPFSDKLDIRLGPEFHSAVVTAARAEQMSINSWIVGVLREAIATQSGDSGRERLRR